VVDPLAHHVAFDNRLGNIGKGFLQAGIAGHGYLLAEVNGGVRSWTVGYLLDFYFG
jgi:hypothetical protein